MPFLRASMVFFIFFAVSVSIGDRVYAQSNSAPDANPPSQTEQGEQVDGLEQLYGKDKAQEITNAYKAAGEVALSGKVDIPLLSQGALHLPEGYSFIPKKEAQRLLQSFGNPINPDLLGLIVPDEGTWTVLLIYDKAGYIRDEEARNWDVDGFLKQLREGTKSGNKERIAKGFHPFAIKGWIEKPSYDETANHLIWSIEIIDETTGEAGSINYNTYVLGREGYINMRLLVEMPEIEQVKPQIRELLNALEYHPGKRYQDFVEGTDSVAKYGIAALIAGGVAKKAGLFAAFGAILLKFSKVLIVLAIGALPIIRNLFTRRKNKTVDYEISQKKVIQPRERENDLTGYVREEDEGRPKG